MSKAMMSNPFDFTGKVVWVTGSSRGIGRGVALHLAAHGASVVAHSRKPDGLSEVMAELGVDHLGVTADVRDDASLAAAVDAIGARYGRLDGVVANVGGAAMGALVQMDTERFRRQLDLNLTSAFATLRAAHLLLAEGEGGAAVLISATAAVNATPMFGPYGAAKAGIEQLTRSLAAEWGPAIRVNCVSPGLVRTEGSMHAVFRGDEGLVAKAGATTAVGRIGETSDIAWACHFLLSSAAGYISGTTLTVDGGPTDGPTQRILKALES